MNSIFNKKNKVEKDTIDTVVSLSNTKWNCKYYIVFIPKYRRKTFYEQKRIEIGKILRRSYPYVYINTTQIISIKIYGDIKGQKQPYNFQRWSNLKYKFRQRSFWCRCYYVDTIGKNEKKIVEYVRNQLQEDMIMMYDQILIKEYNKFLMSFSHNKFLKKYKNQE